MTYGKLMDGLRQQETIIKKKKKTSGIFMDIPEYAGGGRYQNRN